MIFYILILLISSLLLLYLRKVHSYWKNRNIKQINGTLWKFVFGTISFPEQYKKIYDENDSEVGIYIGGKPLLLLRDLEDVQAALASDFHSFYDRGIKSNENEILSNNILFLNNYNKWKIIRQKLTPIFTSAKLKNMFYIMDKCARDFVDLLEENEGFKNSCNDALHVYTTASIGAAVFGIDTKLRNTMDSPFIEMAKKSVASTPWVNILLAIGSYFPKLMAVLNLNFFAEHEEFFVGFVKRVLKERYNDTKKRHDFMDMAIELQKQGTMHDPTTGYSLEPTDEIIAAQAFFFFIAGVDATANTLHFILLELSSNQKILAKVHKEIDSLFENVKEELTYDDVEKLQYLDMVICEVMRKYPIIGSIQRECTKTTVLPGSKVKIEKGSGVLISVLGIHRNEKYFPNPDVFDPERFAPENISKLTKFSYLPFGEGNRVCLGNRFARLQMKAALAWMLDRFTLEEQVYSPKTFDKNFFSLRDVNAKFKLIHRKVK